MATETTQPDELVRGYTEWANGERATADVLAESVDVYNPGLPDGAVHSRAAYEAYVREIRDGFPDLEFTPEEVIAEDDLVMVEYTITGTHQGEFKGIPATGREVAFRGAERFRVADGERREVRVYYDTRAVPEQLGLTFPAILAHLPKLALAKLR